MDVVKTRMMIGNEYSSIANAIYRISKEEGVTTFLVGMTPRLMQKIPANGIFFLTYEYLRRLFNLK